MNKQRLQEIAGITPASHTLAGLFTKAIDSIDQNLSYKDFAEAIAYVLKQDYGQHNFEPFMDILKQELNIENE